MENEAISRPAGCKPSSRGVESGGGGGGWGVRAGTAPFTMSNLLMAIFPLLKGNGKVMSWTEIVAEKRREG